MHILGKKEATWNTIFSIFERRLGPRNVAGPGKTFPLPPSPLSTGLPPPVVTMRRSVIEACNENVLIVCAPTYNCEMRLILQSYLRVCTRLSASQSNGLRCNDDKLIRFDLQHLTIGVGDEGQGGRAPPKFAKIFFSGKCYVIRASCQFFIHTPLYIFRQ